MKGKRIFGLVLSVIVALGAAGSVGYSLPARAAAGSVILSRDEVYDKMLGSWVGQMAGVAWGAPTEFRAQNRILLESEVPAWRHSMINDAFAQDDLFVEIPLIQALLDHGMECDVKTAGEYFRDTAFPLCEANLAARINLRAGIDAPLSGHYLYSNHSDDIDWQIEADFVGQMMPGLVNAAIDKAWDWGHIMCYGDGVYGGVYVAAMHARAFTADTLGEILEAGRRSVPEGSLFRETIEDVHACYDKGLTWQETWQYIQDKWGDQDHCIYGKDIPFNIDAKINSAYVLIGLLYGDGDFEQSMKIAMMCGQDSDCNPSTVGAILGNWMGYEAIPDKWKSALTRSGSHFAFTNKDFHTIVNDNMKLAEEALILNGGTVEGNIWTIPDQGETVPPRLEQLPEICPLDIQAAQVGSSFTFYLLAYDESMIQSVVWDFGDGDSGTGIRTSHQYDTSGAYTVTCTITSTDGDVFTREETCVAGRNIASEGEAIVSHQPQGGGGNPDIGSIADGIRPVPGAGTNMDQFDTYHWGADASEQWIGYTFGEEHTFGMVVFQEGNHFTDGGWFAGGLHIQVQRDGAWSDVDYTGDAYPASSDREAFGESFETFYFYLNNETGTGIRLYGTPGGSSRFISCAELEVYEKDSGTQGEGAYPSPALPVVQEERAEPLFSMNSYDWTWDATMVITPDDTGCLVLQNVDGLWPKADYVMEKPLSVPAANTRIWYDFLVESDVQTSLNLFFGDAGSPLNEARCLKLNSHVPGVYIEPGSGDIVGDGKRHCGYVDLADLGLDPSLISDGSVEFTGIRVYAAGTALTPVVLGQFALVTSDAPVTAPSTEPSDAPVTEPSGEPADSAAEPTAAGPNQESPGTPDTPSSDPEPSASGVTNGESPATGAGLPLAAGVLLAVSSLAVSLTRRGKTLKHTP